MLMHLSSKELPGRVVSTQRSSKPNNADLLTTVKNHLRVTSSTEDALLQVYINAAVDYIERRTGYSLLNQQWIITMDSFPEKTFAQLYHGPVTSVVTFKTYTTANVADTTFAAY